MLFLLTRLFFLIIIFIICYVFIKKSNVINKYKRYLFSFFMAVVFSVLLAFVPIENVFITFSSAESSYNYYNKGYVKLVVEGEATDFVIGQKDEVDIYAIIPKSNNGWKIGLGSNIKRIKNIISDDAVINLYQYKNSDDYYIVVLSSNGGELKISDSRNSKFYYLEGNNESIKSFYKYYSYVNCFDEDYTITVNNKHFSMNNTDK